MSEALKRTQTSRIVNAIASVIEQGVGDGSLQAGVRAAWTDKQLEKAAAVIDSAARVAEADACVVRAEGEVSAAKRAAATELARVELEKIEATTKQLVARLEAGDGEVAKLAEMNRGAVELRAATLRGVAHVVLAVGVAMTALVACMLMC